MFTLDGVEDTDAPNQIQSSEEESDTDGNYFKDIKNIFVYLFLSKTTYFITKVIILYC